MLKQLEMAHWMLKDIINTNDVVVDATMGNGYDTQFLAELGANVYAFDVQEEALNATEKRLDDAGIKNQIFEKNLSNLLTEPSVNLVLSGHEKLSEYVKEPIKAAIFNLGYLPKTDKSVVTKADTTLTALDALTNQLVVGGRIAIMIYYGHEGGMEEKDAVIKWTSSLPQKDWEVTSYAPLNQIHTPPILVLIEKRK
ncbi:MULTISPECIES: tRNA (mnm(5)s(2)U34)-methyltransferase [Lactococcus]|mgnify:FL=1|jgi:protein-L-isoaspartate O-methyltransferase|uniref:Class I SAM-dependent methyltransferase n=2 Tax=Lactococcus lactis TaxID=1358 RepID=A0A2A9HIK1_9LACT|nr:class I SAM-dependent methyltransferase [Lactococcus lactis]ATY88780.1 SAM-dependent methyltransferase [Lactococcus lactis subsp. lactis]ATZ02400.1 SAM-dependent methyltransferase [Lactococcus lactis subsp. lactis]KGF76671.1 SAM-dependent methyltransferase, MraW methylase family [Lactococcus lactis]KLK95223.1 magnesium protoporphyrin O-methyltransferase, bchM [Lactococcus lactis subsp. lactis]KST84087.1 SAM-dependent methyltransferase MraW methylase family [Lactococcus lactis subsp. lactis]